VLLVLALLGLVATVIAYPPSGFELALQRFLASIPHWLDPGSRRTRRLVSS